MNTFDKYDYRTFTFKLNFCFILNVYRTDRVKYTLSIGLISLLQLTFPSASTALVSASSTRFSNSDNYKNNNKKRKLSHVQFIYNTSFFVNIKRKTSYLRVTEFVGTRRPVVFPRIQYIYEI